MIFSKPIRYRKATALIACVLFAAFIGIQATSPEISNPAVSGKFKGPKEVTKIFERACYDCHSNETNLEWYDKIAPFSYIVAADVSEARKRFNFSEWDSIPKADQEGKLWYMVNMISAGKMPLPAYTKLHPDATVSKNDLDVLKKYVTEISSRHYAAGDTSKIKQPVHANVKKPQAVTRKFPTSLNGITYFDDYRNWKVISSTNRFDNGTTRLIYGNDITVKAIRENKINPWPNGAVIVKVVWNSQHEDEDGNVSPGNFNNVQIMIRDDQKYKDTEGWGFARFGGLGLEPYGKTLSFATACIDCHRLVPENGFVFDIPTKKQAINH